MADKKSENDDAYRRGFREGESSGFEAGKQFNRPIFEDTAACRALASVVEYLNQNHGKHLLNEMKRQMPHIRDTLATAEVINRRSAEYVKPSTAPRKRIVACDDQSGDDVCEFVG